MTRTRVRWGRLGVAATTVVVTINLLAGRAGAGGTVHQPQHRTYVVKAGDTLWGIASDLVGPEGDPRPVVDRLGMANHIEAGLIHIGDVLVVPPH